MPDTPLEWPIDGRSAFQSAVLKALAAAQRTLFVVDLDFEGWPLESPAGEEALRAALRKGVTLRLLVRHPDWLARRGVRFMRLRRDFSQRVECREMDSTHHDDDSAIIADTRHVVTRAATDAWIGHAAFDAPVRAREVMGRVSAAWDTAHGCLPATTLGL